MQAVIPIRTGESITELSKVAGTLRVPLLRCGRHTPCAVAPLWQASGTPGRDEREVETEPGRAREAPADERAERIGPPKPPRHFSTLLSITLD